MTDIAIPSSVTEIGNYAFSECSGIGSITLSSSVTEIGDGAFWGCRNLNNITISADKIEKIGSHAFSECSGLSRKQNIGIRKKTATTKNCCTSITTFLVSFVIQVTVRV